MGECSGAVCFEGGEEELDVVVGLGESALVEAVGDGLHGDVGGGDGGGGVVGGGDGGFDALGGQPLGELDQGVDVALGWVWNHNHVGLVLPLLNHVSNLTF